jgi:hypothetical protein
MASAVPGSGQIDQELRLPADAGDQGAQPQSNSEAF